MSTRIHIVVPDELLERLDGQRGLVSRSRWIVALIENALVAAPLVDEPVEIPPDASNEEIVAATRPARSSRLPAQGWTAPVPKK